MADKNNKSPITPEDVLKLANDKGEIGYAYGGDNLDLPAVEICLRKGWIEYGYDASIPAYERYGPQTRSIFYITELGKKVASCN